MWKVFIVLFSLSTTAQKSDNKPLLYVAPELTYLIEFNDPVTNPEGTGLDPRDEEYVGSIGLNLGIYINPHVSISGFVGREEIFSRNVNYQTYALSSNFVFNNNENGWVGSIKIGGHFGDLLRRAGFMSRIGLGFKFHLLKILKLQTEFIYSYQALKFENSIDPITNKNLTINGLGVGCKIYL